MSAPTPHYLDRGERSHSRLSAVAVETADIQLDERKMYAVEWRDGGFGFTLTPVNSDRGTVMLLARRTARREQLEASGLHEVVPGDLLVAIGEEKVYHLGAEHAATFLRSVQKPVRLTLQLSPYGNQAKQLPDLAPNEYHYLWEDGPLGIVLTLDPKSKLPMVKRLSDKANEIVRREVQVSDQLMYANDVPTSEYSMDEVMSILREMPKPVLLRFRKQLQDDHLVELPELAENEYEFLWDYGPLGLVIGMSRSGLPFVRSFTGLGTSRQLNLVQEDDEIVMVNDKSAIEVGFRETMQYLMNAPKPAVLRFRRKIRNMDERNSQGMRATTSARPSTPGYQKPGVPECEGPLSPVAPLGASTQNFHTGEPPLSPQVRVSLDRSRFRSVSSARSSNADDRSSQSSSSQDGRSGVAAVAAAVGARQTIPKGERISEDGDDRRFEDARSPQSSTGAQSGTEDRETAILPPDPRVNKAGDASRSSIFTFSFDEGAPPASDPPRPRRISAKTGSMPPDPVVEPFAQHEDLSRSQSFHPSTKTPGAPAFVPLPDPVKERHSIHAKAPEAGGTAEPTRTSKPTLDTAELVPEPPAVAVQEPAPKRQPARTSMSAIDTAELVAEPAAVTTISRPQPARTSKPAIDTAELVAEPVPVATVSRPQPARASKPIDTAELVAEPAAVATVSRPQPSRNNKPAVVDTAELVAEPAPQRKYVDTAELVADPASVLPKIPVDNQAPSPVAKPVQQAKTRPSKPASNQYEDTADLVAEPAPKPAKKTYVDTAELVAEPVKADKTAVRSKPAYVDTAELLAEPSPVKKTAPPKKQYLDTADLVAAPPVKKEFVDTADLVAVPAPAPKAKQPIIDTAELFAEPTPKPVQVASTPTQAPTPAPVPAPVSAPTPGAAHKPASTSTPAPAPVKTVASDGGEFFTVDPAAFYTVQWTDGPFGSTVREAESTTGPVMLITKRTGKQTCAGLRRIAVGDILVRIGDKDVSSMGFEKATRYLRKVPKPVPLTFQAID